MEDHQVCGIAFTTSDADPFYTAVLAYPGTPNFKLRTVHEVCVTSPGKHPTVIDSGRISLGTQVDLWGILADPTLLVFWMDIVQDVCVY